MKTRKVGNVGLCIAGLTALSMSGCSRDHIEAINLANEGDQSVKVNVEGAITKYEQAIQLAPTNHRILWKLANAPAAGLAVTDARVTQTIEGLAPGVPVRRVRQDELAQGVIAFAAIRAPAGLSQEVIFEWRHNDERERISIEIQGGKADGFRAYSRKQIFPVDSVGLWTVDVLTPQAQLLQRLRFVVEG